MPSWCCEGHHAYSGSVWVPNLFCFLRSLTLLWLKAKNNGLHLRSRKETTNNLFPTGPARCTKFYLRPSSTRIFECVGGARPCSVISSGARGAWYKMANKRRIQRSRIKEGRRKMRGPFSFGFLRWKGLLARSEFHPFDPFDAFLSGSLELRSFLPPACPVCMHARPGAQHACH